MPKSSVDSAIKTAVGFVMVHYILMVISWLTLYLSNERISNIVDDHADTGVLQFYLRY